MNGRVFLIVEGTDLSERVKRFLTSKFPHWLEGTIEKVYVPETISFTDVLPLYESVCQVIEQKTDFAGLRNSVAVVDLQFLNLASLNVAPNPLSTSQQKSHASLTLACLLVLSFPELRWLFYGWQGKNPAAKIRTHHAVSTENLTEIIAGPYVAPLFDPSGLRNYLRACIKNSPETKEQAKALSLREHHCAAIDDEESYAFLHGYVGYKLGLRVHTVTTESMLSEVFGQPVVVGQGGAATAAEMTFEDIFLNFPDRSSEDYHLSDLRKRDELYPGLPQVKRRIFITAGHQNVDWYDENQAYIEELKVTGRAVEPVYKPSGGIYNILEKGELLFDYWSRRRVEWRAAQPGPEGGVAAQTGHSAPGRLLLIAERLIARADTILRQAVTVQDCIHGATLVLEAQELLAYRTPTTSLEAIALRHQLETMAECMFYGVGYSKDVKNRFVEIEAEVKAVGQWFHSSVRERSMLNAQMSITTEVMRVFREAGQFDEEQQCLIHLRELHRRAFLLNRPKLKFINPVLWYVEKLVSSFPLFVVAILFWPTLFGFLSWVTGAQFGEPGSIQHWNGHMTHSFVIFFGIGPAEFPKSFAQPFTVLLMILGFMHLGIFITHLYTLLSRR